MISDHISITSNKLRRRDLGEKYLKVGRSLRQVDRRSLSCWPGIVIKDVVVIHAGLESSSNVTPAPAAPGNESNLSII
jgi:hypothetical protein